MTSFTNHLFLYDEFNLIWAARTDHITHTLALSEFDGTKGLLTLLNDEGWLSVCYLGTEPPQVVYTYS